MGIISVSEMGVSKMGIPPQDIQVCVKTYARFVGVISYMKHCHSGATLREILSPEQLGAQTEYTSNGSLVYLDKDN